MIRIFTGILKIIETYVAVVMNIMDDTNAAYLVNQHHLEAGCALDRAWLYLLGLNIVVRFLQARTIFH
jgi:hypothetical protein